jgi:hypothetical protein
MDGDGGQTAFTYHGQRRGAWSWLVELWIASPSISHHELIEFKIRKALCRVGRAALGTVNDID